MPHIRAEISWGILRRAALNSAHGDHIQPLIDTLEKAGFYQDHDRAVFVAEPATEEQLVLTMQVYRAADYPVDFEPYTFACGGLP